MVSYWWESGSPWLRPKWPSDFHRYDVRGNGYSFLSVTVIMIESLRKRSSMFWNPWHKFLATPLCTVQAYGSIHHRMTLGQKRPHRRSERDAERMWGLCLHGGNAVPSQPIIGSAWTSWGPQRVMGRVPAKKRYWCILPTRRPLIAKIPQIYYEAVDTVIYQNAWRDMSPPPIDIYDIRYMIWYDGVY